MLYLHQDSLSPDPTYGRQLAKRPDGTFEQVIYPHELKRVVPDTAAARRWGRQLNIFKRPPALTLRAGADHRIIITVDFGTELNAFLELDVTTTSLVTLMTWHGESLEECEDFVMSQFPDPRTGGLISKAGRHRLTACGMILSHNGLIAQAGRYPANVARRGFRFVRLVFSDVKDELTIHCLSARASFTFGQRAGDLQCSDRRFQRAWQSSVYTAHLCTQGDTIWDGVKRDRGGWFGDARVTKMAIDNVFFDPRPAEAMLAGMPTDEWANTIPNYSFDGICMLKQHILFYGLQRPCVRECFKRVKALLGWAKATQIDRNGFIKRTNRNYYGGMGFLDYSPHPIGGRFEELCWMQCKYLEALRAAIDVALLLKDFQAAHAWQGDADRLAKRIVKRFWKPGVGFIHTLNHAGAADNPYASGYDEHYRKTYIEKIRLGPSGPSRHSNALAVLAGLATEPMKEVILRGVFRNKSFPAINTAYFSYFEKSAWAECGDPVGAILGLRDYLGQLLENEDSATLWEWYDPNVRDMRKYGVACLTNWACPTSLCHGWGAGLVPIAARYMMGISPTGPGYRSITLKPLLELPWSYRAVVPTPEGAITVERNDPKGPVRYSVPAAIKIEGMLDPNIAVSRSK